MLLEFSQIPPWVQDWLYSRKNELVPPGAEVHARLNEATEVMQKLLTTKEARRAFLKFDDAYGALLVKEGLAAFSLGFELGRHPEVLLGEMVEL
jgi:hypothetical protein